MPHSGAGVGVYHDRAQVQVHMHAIYDVLGLICVMKFMLGNSLPHGMVSS